MRLWAASAIVMGFCFLRGVPCGFDRAIKSDRIAATGQIVECGPRGKWEDRGVGIPLSGRIE
jgi:hypothetical protein